MVANDPKELTVLRRKLDEQYIERLNHLEIRFDHLDERIHAELSTLDQRIHAELSTLDQLIENKLIQSEARIAEKTIYIAVKQAFGHLGVDVNDPKDMERFRSDLRFGGVFRDATARGFRAIVATIFGAIGLSLWMVFKDHIDVNLVMRRIADMIIGKK